MPTGTVKKRHSNKVMDEFEKVACFNYLTCFPGCAALSVGRRKATPHAVHSFATPQSVHPCSSLTAWALIAFTPQLHSPAAASLLMPWPSQLRPPPGGVRPLLPPLQPEKKVTACKIKLPTGLSVFFGVCCPDPAWRARKRAAWARAAALACWRASSCLRMS